MLTATDVCAGYGRIEAVTGVSLDVRAGEIVTLIGANGAGKSTLLRTLAGVLRPSRGEIAWHGRSILRLGAPARVREGIVLVPEGRGILQRMTVRENLLMGAYARRRGDATRGIEQALERFPHLQGRTRQLAGTLSGGEQQMLAIARALVAGPRLLMLDEPSLGLAPRMVDAIMRTIGELRTAGITVLLVEQNARQALQLADRGYVMASGRVVLEGPARELLTNAGVQTADLGAGGGSAGGSRGAPGAPGAGCGAPGPRRRS